MTNPYSTPAGTELICVTKNLPVHLTRSTTILATSSASAFIALALGMATCWLRLGWLDLQSKLPITQWRLPTYFWFHCGVWLVTAIVLSILTLPMYLYLRGSVNVSRLMCLVFAISTTATIGFEAFKRYDMIEPPTHALIVLVSSSTLLLTMCLMRLSRAKLLSNT